MTTKKTTKKKAVARKKVSEVDEIKKVIRKGPRRDRSKKFLHTGSTLLNLAASDTPFGGYALGSYIYFVGDSNSGKTWFSLALMAEAALSNACKDYKLIYDAIEGGAQMDLSHYFGKKLASRIEPPSKRGPSEHLEQFYYNIDGAMDLGPCIYILDSMDALDAEEDIKYFENKKKKDTNGTAKADDAGTYGTAKANINSRYIRRVSNRVRKTGSILLIISQTRENLKFGHETKTRSGGKGLSFYADVEAWFAKRGALTKTVRGKARNVGTISKIQVKRTRTTGKSNVIEVPIYEGHGIDDTGNMIDYLVDENEWDKEKQSIITPWGKMSRDKLIKEIEDNNREKDVASIVGEVWEDIAQASRIQRKNRYA